MKEVCRVGSIHAARQIAAEAAKAMWRYTIPSSFYDVQFDEEDKAWNVEADYFEETLTFRIDALTGNVSGFKITRKPPEQF